MKKSLRYLLPFLTFAAAWPLARAQDPNQPPPKEEKRSLRVVTGPDHRPMMRRNGGAEMETVTFLGVETSPVSATLTAQLSLQEGAGLVVNHVAPDSPASAVFKQHDILLKLDDQQLIDPRQFAVLVRNHKEGDEVTLTFLRAGKSTTAKVKLAKHEAPKLALDLNQPGDPFAPLGGMFGPGNVNVRTMTIQPGESAPGGGDPGRILGMMNGGMAMPGMQHMTVRSAGNGERNISVSVNTGNSHVNLDDEQGTLDLTITDGKKLLVAKNKQGEQTFSGPIDTPEQRKALPADVRGRLEKLEDSTQFSFKPDGDFQGAETKIAHPRGQGIAAPLPPPSAGRAPLFF